MKDQLLNIKKLPAPIRILSFLLILLLIWLPVAFPVKLWFGNYQTFVTIIAMGWLFCLFMILVKITGQWIYGQSKPYQAVGFIWSKRNGQEILKGLMIGLILTFSLFVLQGMLGWLSWQENASPFWQLIPEGALIGIGVGITEEAVFRGWLLNELERDYSLRIALWVNSIIFAIAHFLKPLDVIIKTLPAFPGLIMLGLILVWARRKNQGRLGLPIGLHAGLVWGYYVVDVGELIRYTDAVSPAITGIYGNPIAGVMGWIFLLGLSLGLTFKRA